MTDTERTNLLPCPFCGGKADLQFSRDEDDCWVRCLTCWNGTKLCDDTDEAEQLWQTRQIRRALDNGAVSQDEALEFITKCCRLGLLDRGTTLVDELAAQISALRQPQPDTRERDLALIEFSLNPLAYSVSLDENGRIDTKSREEILAAFDQSRSGGK